MMLLKFWSQFRIESLRKWIYFCLFIKALRSLKIFKPGVFSRNLTVKNKNFGLKILVHFRHLPKGRKSAIFGKKSKFLKFLIILRGIYVSKVSIIDGYFGHCRHMSKIPVYFCQMSKFSIISVVSITVLQKCWVSKVQFIFVRFLPVRIPVRSIFAKDETRKIFSQRSALLFINLNFGTC